MRRTAGSERGCIWPADCSADKGTPRRALRYASAPARSVEHISQKQTQAHKAAAAAAGFL